MSVVEHRFGPYGGQYVPETLMPALAELEGEWLAARRRRKVPAILSGGMTAENVADGIAAVDPYAVDVASGVEAAPGIKDPAKLAEFMAAAASVPAGASW